MNKSYTLVTYNDNRMPALQKSVVVGCGFVSVISFAFGDYAIAVLSAIIVGIINILNINIYDDLRTESINLITTLSSPNESRSYEIYNIRDDIVKVSRWYLEDILKTFDRSTEILVFTKIDSGSMPNGRIYRNYTITKKNKITYLNSTNGSRPICKSHSNEECKSCFAEVDAMYCAIEYPDNQIHVVLFSINNLQ